MTHTKQGTERDGQSGISLINTFITCLMFPFAMMLILATLLDAAEHLHVFTFQLNQLQQYLPIFGALLGGMAMRWHLDRLSTSQRLGGLAVTIVWQLLFCLTLIALHHLHGVPAGSLQIETGTGPAVLQPLLEALENLLSEDSWLMAPGVLQWLYLHLVPQSLWLLLFVPPAGILGLTLGYGFFLNQQAERSPSF